MKKIIDQIQWYKQNSNSLYDDMVSIELEKINMLYERYTDHTDEMFVEEMIESFCKIIERQREKISDLENEVDMCNVVGSITMSESDVAHGDDILQTEFQNDKQLQEAFTSYCLDKGKSSYTVNDYCSRLKKLWNSFYEAYQKGELPEELDVIKEKIELNAPLMNVYHHMDELHCYVSMMVALNEGNRNWANSRAAFNKFEEFKRSINKSKEIR